MIQSIDHLIVTVNDLDAAILSYTKVLGLEPSWKGVHEDLGTSNALFVMDNIYLELLAADGSEGLGSAMVKATLELNGEGLSGLVLGTENVVKVRENLLKKSSEIKELSYGTGFDSFQGLKRTWKNLFLPFSLTRGLFAFVIEHESEKLPFKIPQASSVNKLDHVVINTNDPDGLIDLYRDTFGIRLALDQTIEKWGGRMLFFRLNQTTLEVIGKPDTEEPVDKLWGLAWTVKDLHATYERLQEQGVDVTPVKEGRKDKTLVCTIKSDTCGVPTLLIQHLS